MMDIDAILYWQQLSDRLASQIDDEKKLLLRGMDDSRSREDLVNFISWKEIPFVQKQKIYYSVNLSQVNLFHTTTILDLLHFQLDLLRHPDPNNACQVVLSTQKRIEHSRENLVK